jgi:hypothetical protein
MIRAETLTNPSLSLRIVIKENKCLSLETIEVTGDPKKLLNPFRTNKVSSQEKLCFTNKYQQ